MLLLCYSSVTFYFFLNNPMIFLGLTFIGVQWYTV